MVAWRVGGIIFKLPVSTVSIKKTDGHSLSLHPYAMHRRAIFNLFVTKPAAAIGFFVLEALFSLFDPLAAKLKSHGTLD